MRAVVHVGMNKTGSTAIQAAFHGRATPEYEYLESAGINHLDLLRQLYPASAGDEPRARRASGEAAARRARAQARFAAQLDRVAPTDLTLIVSSEALWSPRRADLRAALLADLHARGARTEALGYVRPPMSHAVSRFQQRLKRLEPVPPFDPGRLYPAYRPAIEALDRSFGPGHVRLRLFSRAALAGGDVVRDFAEAVGVPVPPPKAGSPRANESLGAEAIAVLYARLRRGPGLDLRRPDAAAEARRLIEVLRGLGSRRLAVAPGVWRDVLDLHRDDLAWTEARLGRALGEAAEPDAVVVGTEDDLLRLAEAAAGHDAAREFSEGLEALRASHRSPGGVERDGSAEARRSAGEASAAPLDAPGASEGP